MTDHSVFFSGYCRPCPSLGSQEVLTVAAPPVDLASNIAGPVCCVSGGGLVSRLSRTTLWGPKDTDGSRATNIVGRAAQFQVSSTSSTILNARRRKDVEQTES